MCLLSCFHTIQRHEKSCYDPQLRIKNPWIWEPFRLLSRNRAWESKAWSWIHAMVVATSGDALLHGRQMFAATGNEFSSSTSPSSLLLQIQIQLQRAAETWRSPSAWVLPLVIRVLFFALGCFTAATDWECVPIEVRKRRSNAWHFTEDCASKLDQDCSIAVREEGGGAETCKFVRVLGTTLEIHWDVRWQTKFLDLPHSEWHAWLSVEHVFDLRKKFRPKGWRYMLWCQ